MDALIIFGFFAFFVFFFMVIPASESRNIEPRNKFFKALAIITIIGACICIGYSQSQYNVKSTQSEQEKPSEDIKMEKLTARDENGNIYYLHCESTKCNKHCNECDFNATIANKLAKYEESESKRLLLELPCKVGDTIYVLFSKNDTWRYEECEVEQIIIHAGTIEMNALIKLHNCRTRLNVSSFGKTIFYTPEDAETACNKLNQ